MSQKRASDSRRRAGNLTTPPVPVSSPPVTPLPFPGVHANAEVHLKSVPELAPVVAAVGPCTLSPEPDLFRVLVRAMIAQLISTAAARSITTRLEAAVSGRVKPAAVAGLTDEQFKSCGISGGKMRAIRELADHFRRDPDFPRRVAEADDAAVRGLLLPLRGVGPWTVDMVMMFSIFRPDVLPVGDLGLRAGVRDLYRLEGLPTAVELERLAEPWRPYRTVATWYIWRSRGWPGTSS